MPQSKETSRKWQNNKLYSAIKTLPDHIDYGKYYRSTIRIIMKLNCTQNGIVLKEDIIVIQMYYIKLNNMP